MKKTITIKNALISDKEHLDKLATSKGVSVAEAFSYLITTEKTAKTEDQIAEIRKDYEETEANLKQSVLDATREKAELSRKLDEQTELLNKDAEQTLSLQNRITELEKELEAKANEVKPPVLTDFQFICELSEKDSRNARKIRSFMKKQGFYEPVENETPAQYINALVNVSVPFFMKRNFIDYID